MYVIVIKGDIEVTKRLLVANFENIELNFHFKPWL